MAFKTSVPRERLESIANAAGCKVDVKASYIKITKGKSMNCLFIAKTKDVSRIDIGGFDYTDASVVKNLGGESHGCVHQQMRADVSGAALMLGFKTICEGLDTFTSHPKKERKPAHSFRRKGQQNVQTVVTVVVEETPEQTVNRLVKKLEVIRAQSKVMGIPVSKKTELELGQKIEAAKVAANISAGA